MTRTIPYSLDVEESLLGTMLLSRQAAAVGLEACASPMFHKPQHAVIFDAIAALHALGAPIDPTTTAEQLRRTGHLERVGGKTELLRLHGTAPASGNAEHYASVVADLATFRRVIATAEAISAAGYDQDTDAVTKLLREAVDLGGAAVPVNVGLDVLDLAERDITMRWLVTDLIEMGDRIVVSGPEGWGKTTLLRQWGLMLASGIHPVKRTPTPPVKVVMVDCENSGAQNTRAFRWLLKRVALTYTRGQMTVVERPQGMNLRSQTDARWLDGVLTHHQPDVLVIGPLYKLFEGSSGVRKDSEEAADEVARVFDRLRTKHDVAMLIEAHSPHGDGGDRAGYRPYGASLRMRWPEFGFGMKPDGKERVELISWRGARDRNRDWPQYLYEGEVWPWEANDVSTPTEQGAMDL